MKVLGFIPARKGSKGIASKNILPIDGKPMIAWSIEEGVKSCVDRLVVSTDSPKIAEISKSYGAEVPYMRPDNLAQDHSVLKDAMINMVEFLNREQNYYPDVIVILQPTSPLRLARHIDESVEMLKNESCDSVLGVSNPMEHPGDMVYWDDSGKMNFLIDLERKTSQRQQFPDLTFINGAIYTFHVKNLECEEHFLGEKVLPYIMDQIYSIDIDTPDDLIIAEAVLAKRRI